ncbi:hypothetical protein HYW35_03210 [Candidatus Saccharibacteria bacterium]|nr:hypothetical protein [Candidatus Saccharibacteria bacterium]
MVKLNKNVLAATAAIAAVGSGFGVAADRGVFHSSRGDIIHTPKVGQRLEQTIKPEMKLLGKLVIKFADRYDQFYDSETGTVTVEAENNSPIVGETHVRAEFAPKPGTHQADPNHPLFIQTDHVGHDSTATVVLSAPLTASSKELYNAYAASSVGDDYHGALIRDTTDTEWFVDSSYDRRAHNPVPTAKAIVRDQGPEAVYTIRNAFEQPSK